MLVDEGRGDARPILVFLDEEKLEGISYEDLPLVITIVI